MNHEKFSEKGDGFEVCGFRIELDWKTPDSISFSLCHHPASNVRYTFGWLDVHQTDEKCRRVKMRFCLDHNYLKLKDHREVIEAVCDQLSLPHDSYEVTFVSPLKQTSWQTSDCMEFVSYGPPFDPEDNHWDDRDGISPLEVIHRDEAFGMLLEAFPEFHRQVDSAKYRGERHQIGDQFLGVRNTFHLVDALEAAYRDDDPPQLQRVFALLEKLTTYGDEYTRNASLVRLFERQLQMDLAQKFVPYMQEKTLGLFNKTAAEYAEWNAKRKK